MSDSSQTPEKSPQEVTPDALTLTLILLAAAVLLLFAAGGLYMRLDELYL
ncbi:MAG: hypothetical protein QM811_15805 [Pirellulales bacterium]